MTDRRDAERGLVFYGQVRQYLSVNIVLAKRLLIAPQSQPPQPLPDVHSAPPWQWRLTMLTLLDYQLGYQQFPRSLSPL
jgi:hypothetical protein